MLTKLSLSSWSGISAENALMRRYDTARDQWDLSWFTMAVKGCYLKLLNMTNKKLLRQNDFQQ